MRNALAGLAARNPEPDSTVYLLQGPSINFGEPRSSAFFSIAGPKSVRETLYGAFGAFRGLNLRYSDFIAPAQAECQCKMEDGRLWCLNDYLTWYVDGPEQMTSAPMGAAEDEIDEENEDNMTSSEDANAEVATESAGPVESSCRAACADRNIATIRRTIESVFGLPEGSVALRAQDKQNLRGDASVATLCKRWEQ